MDVLAVDDDGNGVSELISRTEVGVIVVAPEFFVGTIVAVLRETQGGTYLVDSLAEVGMVGCSDRVTGRGAGLDAGATALGASDCNNSARFARCSSSALFFSTRENSIVFVGETSETVWLGVETGSNGLVSLGAGADG